MTWHTRETIRGVPAAFEKPAFSHQFKVAAGAKRAWRDDEPRRSIPPQRNDHLVVGWWNIANLGGQDRQPDHYRLLAEIVSWFDVCAVREVKDDLRGLRGVLAALTDDHGDWRTAFTDGAGNDERLAVVYDAGVLELAETIGELATLRRPGARNILELVNVHLYVGMRTRTRSPSRPAR